MLAKLTTREEEVLGVLNQRELVTAEELEQSTSIPRVAIAYTIRKIRKKFLEGYEVPYIFTAKGGYTLRETASTLAHETRTRLKMGTSIILNGSYVYEKFKKKALRGFQEVFMEYKPKLLDMSNMTGGGK